MIYANIIKKGGRVSVKYIRFLSAVLILSASMGCIKGPAPTAKLEDVVAKDSGSNREIKEMNDRLFASVSGAPQPKDYVLGEGDLVLVSVFEAQELKAEVRVGARGHVSLPLLGAVEVAGLTAGEAEKKIEDLYRRKYLQDPHVSVFVKEHVSGKITLMGAFKKPGTYDYYARQNLLDVLAIGEGLSEKAGRTVQVRRKSADPNRPSTFLIDLDELIKSGRSELNLEIKGGDMIYVLEAGMVYVDGAVRKPGSYPITQSMTVQEVIALAGGFSKIAKETDIKLVRLAQGGKREVVQLNMNDKGEGAGRNIELKDRDVVFVETNPVEALVYGMMVNFGFMGFGFNPPSTRE